MHLGSVLGSDRNETWYVEDMYMLKVIDQSQMKNLGFKGLINLIN